MSCCGQKRATAKQAALRTPIQPYSPPVSNRTVTQPDQAGTVPMRYLGATPISLRGSNSGRIYYFDRADAIMDIHASDVDALLRTQLFTHEQG